MKIRLAMLVLLPLLAVSLAGGAASEDSSRTLKGQFDWSQGNETGELSAKFTPTGPSSWTVSFHFDFSGSHTYTGTAEGALAEGASLKGTAREDRGNRTWRFAGTFKNGRFNGEHFETSDGDEDRSGTLTLFL